MTAEPLRILHCLRAPVGGLFRHVRDLAREQSVRGAKVGVLCDAVADDPLTEARLDEMAKSLALGLHKVPMSREIGLADIAATRTTRRITAELQVDVLHGHGAKGGAYARLAAAAVKQMGQRVTCFYTPHGGSLHYGPTTLKGRAFMAAERHLMGATDGLIFESRYAADTFATKVGVPTCAYRVVHNGVSPDELDVVTHTADAKDFLFIGELRHLKGVDVLLTALAELAKSQPVTAVIVGAGPDAATFHAQATALGLDGVVTFAGAMPARQAFALGRRLVMPSRAESLPYVALEAAGAGLPLIASRVGGMPEIVAGTGVELVEPGDAVSLAAAMQSALINISRAGKAAAELRRVISERFTVSAMTDGVLAFYADVAARRTRALAAAE